MSTKDDTSFTPDMANFMGCSDHSLRCVKQTVFDGTMAVSLFAIMSYVVDRKIIPFDKIMLFALFWVPIVFISKYYKMESSEQFARVAFWSVANKTFEILK